MREALAPVLTKVLLPFGSSPFLLSCLDAQHRKAKAGDKLYFWGHGGGIGSIWVNKSEIIKRPMIYSIAAYREAHHLGKLDLIELHACDTADSSIGISAWLKLGKVLKAYPGLTAEEWPPHINPIQTYTHSPKEPSDGRC